MAFVIVDSFTGTTNAFRAEASTTYHDGQSWTTTESYDLAKFSFLCYRHASDSPGNVTAYLYAAAATELPTGGVLATADAKDCSGITTDTAGEWVEFIFSTPYTLANASRYAVVFLTSNASKPTFYTNARVTTDLYTGGRAVRGGSPTWYGTVGTDTFFRAYKETVENYSELAGTIATVSDVSGNLDTTIVNALSGTIAATSAVGSASLGQVAVSLSESVMYKRLVAVGNDRFYYEDI